uniref:Uncharacterized protein n=1 Tax=Desertifilum tharense IPPAS B-1220 TaxID=1781255 RepID=A0ACD5GR54_9CYAN
MQISLMDESKQNSRSPFSVPQFLKEIENILVAETQGKITPWVSGIRVSHLFKKKHGISPDTVAKCLGYENGFKHFLQINQSFSLYNTLIPHNFYIAFFSAVFPGWQVSQDFTTQYRIKRAWKVDGRLYRMLKLENAKEVQFSPPPQVSEYDVDWLSTLSAKDERNRPTQVSPKKEYKPVLESKIESVDDLVKTITEILKELTGDRVQEWVEISVLSKKFYDYYQQPIRGVVRQVYKGGKLIDILKSCMHLEIQESNQVSQVCLKMLID